MRPPLDPDPLAKESLSSFLAGRGVTRREFLRFCGKMAAVIGAGAAAGTASRAVAKEIAAKLQGLKRPNVLYLQLQECTGCVESVLRSGSTPVEELILEHVSLDYNELLMAAAGRQANDLFEAAVKEPHLLIVNGSVPLGSHGAYCTIGGQSAQELLKKAAQNATAVLAVGACAEYGGIQAAGPNPTEAVGIGDVVNDKPVVNISGCPPIPEAITATVTYFLTYGHTPPVDTEGRPRFLFAERIHDRCPRRASYDAGVFADRFDDDNARKGACLYRLGCKGPATFGACPTVQWNLGESFPVKAGHPCLGCTERHFVDRMAPFYRRIPGLAIPGGGEVSANTIGGVAVAASVGGVAAHSAATVLARHRRSKDERETVPLKVLGESKESQDSKRK